MPHVLIVSTVASGGSTGAAVAADAIEALDRGCEVTVASGRGRPGAALRERGVRHIPIGSRADAALHFLLSRVFDAEGRGSLTATRTFIRKAKALRPSVIILHNLHGRYLNLRLVSRWLAAEAARGVEIVWTLHDVWAISGHCAFLPPSGCTRFASPEGCRRCPMKSAYPASFFDRSHANFERKRKLLEPLAPHLRLRAVSRLQASWVERSYLKAARVEVCYPRVGREFTPLPEGAPRAGFVLAAAWPWQKYKGLDDLAAIRRALPAGVDFVVVGLTPRQARRLRPLGIVCAGRQTVAADMAWYFRQAGVFVNPSYAESYGLAIREALACGTPVATYDAGACTEGLDGRDDFRAVACGDVDGLVREAMALRRRSPSDAE